MTDKIFWIFVHLKILRFHWNSGGKKLTINHLIYKSMSVFILWFTKYFQVGKLLMPEHGLIYLWTLYSSCRIQYCDTNWTRSLHSPCLYSDPQSTKKQRQIVYGLVNHSKLMLMLWRILIFNLFSQFNKHGKFYTAILKHKLHFLNYSNSKVLSDLMSHDLVIQDDIQSDLYVEWMTFKT